MADEVTLAPQAVQYDPFTGVPAEFNEYLPKDCEEYKRCAMLIGTCSCSVLSHKLRCILLTCCDVLLYGQPSSVTVAYHFLQATV